VDHVEQLDRGGVRVKEATVGPVVPGDHRGRGFGRYGRGPLPYPVDERADAHFGTPACPPGLEVAETDAAEPVDHRRHVGGE